MDEIYNITTYYEINRGAPQRMTFSGSDRDAVGRMRRLFQADLRQRHGDAVVILADELGLASAGAAA